MMPGGFLQAAADPSCTGRGAGTGATGDLRLDGRDKELP
jgi:hypothetical protein